MVGLEKRFSEISLFEKQIGHSWYFFLMTRTYFQQPRKKNQSRSPRQKKVRAWVIYTPSSPPSIPTFPLRHLVVTCLTIPSKTVRIWCLTMLCILFRDVCLFQILAIGASSSLQVHIVGASLLATLLEDLVAQSSICCGLVSMCVRLFAHFFSWRAALRECSMGLSCLAACIYCMNTERLRVNY